MKAPKCFLFLLLMSGLFFILTWQAQAGNQKIEVAFQVSINELVKKMPKKMTVYRTVPDEVGQTQREALKTFLGKGSHFELQEASGGIFAGDMTRMWAKAPKFTDEIKDPNEKHILMTTENFLAKIKGQPGEQQTVRRVSVDTMELMNKSGERRSLPMGINVTYRRLLEGYEVVGPGGKLKIFHDTNGDVVGYLRVWRKLSPEKEAQPLIPIRQAVGRFKENPLGRSLLSDVKKVEVTEIRIAYLEHGITVSQHYLQPIYFFSCIALVKSGDRTAQIPYVRYMGALVKPPETLWPSGRKHEPGIRPKTLAKPGED